MALRWPDAGAAVLVVPAACSGLWSPLLTSGLLEQVLTAEVEEDKPRVCSGSQVERSAACRLTCRCRCMRARDPLRWPHSDVAGRHRCVMLASPRLEMWVPCVSPFAWNLQVDFS